MLEKREERTNQSTLFRRFGGGGNDNDRANKVKNKGIIKKKCDAFMMPYKS